MDRDPESAGRKIEIRYKYYLKPSSERDQDSQNVSSES